MTLINKLMEIFSGEPNLSAEDKRTQEWAQAVKTDNWVRLHQLRFEQNLDPHDFFDHVALAYCYCYAAGAEPTRNADWTAFKKTLENLHYPAMAEAIMIRNERGHK